jgi:hypothetical protein
MSVVGGVTTVLKLRTAQKGSVSRLDLDTSLTCAHVGEAAQNALGTQPVSVEDVEALVTTGRLAELYIDTLNDQGHTESEGLRDGNDTCEHFDS